jgi:hypothetical protein
LSNREILHRYILPKYSIGEKTSYTLINVSTEPGVIRQQQESQAQLTLF